MEPSYADYFDMLRTKGDRVVTRGMSVREIHNVNLAFIPGEMLGRKQINNRIGLAEGLMLIAGIFDQNVIRAVAPKARLDLFTEQAAYGPRLALQLPEVERALRRDGLSRRAAVTYLRPDEAGSPDAPCTLATVFTMRRGLLFSSTTMRSSDAVWGLPYDIIQFGMLTAVMARIMSAEVTGCRLSIVNAHVYDATAHLTPGVATTSFEVTAKLIDWDAAQAWARGAIDQLVAGQMPAGLVIHGALQ